MVEKAPLPLLFLIDQKFREKYHMSPEGPRLSHVFQVQKLQGALSGLSSRLAGTQRIEERQKGIESLSLTGLRLLW